MWLFITHPCNLAVITLHFMIGVIVKEKGEKKLITLSFQIRDRFNKNHYSFQIEKERNYLESFEYEFNVNRYYFQKSGSKSEEKIFLCFVYYCLVRKLLFVQLSISTFKLSINTSNCVIILINKIRDNRR